MTDSTGPKESTNVADQTLEIIARITGHRPAELARPLNLAVDLGLDSPKALELLMALEDDLGFEISDDEAATLKTVGDILDLTARRTARG